MELIDDNRQARKHQLSGILVRSPHVNRKAFYRAFVPELVQPGGNSIFVSGGQHVDGNAVLYVRDDASELTVNLCLVNAKPLGKPSLVPGIHGGDVVRSQCPYRLVITANMLGNADKRIPQTLCLDVFHAPLGHPHVGLDAAQRLQERLFAVLAPVPLYIGQDDHGGAPDGAIAVLDGLDAMFVWSVNNPAFGAVGRLDGVLASITYSPPH
jgi:hypothetical protein